MSEEILINVTPQETRVALVENGVLQEVHVERERQRGIVGNIYKGRVARILPGMQAAFIDIGGTRAAFLHVAEMLPLPEGSHGGAAIHERLREHSEIVVQVMKDPLGTKGARLTMQLTLPARYAVYLPYSKHIGISQKISDELERERLRDLLRSATEEGDAGGYILRTLAETVDEDEIRKDVRYLRRAWDAVRQRIADAPVGTLIHEELPLALRSMRDLVRDETEKIRIDSREFFTRASEFAQEFVPEVVDRIEHYPGERPIFDIYSVEDEIRKALARKVPLKSGGHVVIDQTEAMTTIDVNTGAYVGKHNLEETLFKTNLEATQAIARQLRLRNLGGIILVDFIDMADTDHKRQVLRALEKAVARDRTKVSFSEMSPLGLVELTRKRTRESLEHVLCQPCPVCHGRGSLKTPQTVCYEIFREILREARQYGANEYLLLASQTVVDVLMDDESASLLGLQEFIRRPIQLKVEPTYHQEQYDIVLL